MAEAQPQYTTEHESPFGFAATLEKIEARIAGAGLTVFARIDHAAGARDAGLPMPPATVLIYGHARGGTPVMLAAPLAALDLPLRVLVHQRQDGRVAIAFHPAAAVLGHAGVPDELLHRLDGAQQLLVAALQA